MLQRATVDTFHQLLDALTESTGIDAAKCPVMVVSGNTAMIHFLLGLDHGRSSPPPMLP